MNLRRETLKQKNHISKLEKSNDMYKERLLCKICMNVDVDRMLLPSGKMICHECVTKISGVCPFTRKRVESVIRLYF
jgi:late competence protein required for DNA uptake (superfamily II DNA/RNA helicase)